MRTGAKKLIRIVSSTRSDVSRAHGHPFRDRGVVHDAVEVAEGVPRLARERHRRVEVAEVDRPQP